MEHETIDLRLKGSEIRISQGRLREALDLLLRGTGIKAVEDPDDPTQILLASTGQATDEEVETLAKEITDSFKELKVSLSTTRQEDD